MGAGLGPRYTSNYGSVSYLAWKHVFTNMMEIEPAKGTSYCSLQFCLISKRKVSSLQDVIYISSCMFPPQSLTNCCSSRKNSKCQCNSFQVVIYCHCCLFVLTCLPQIVPHHVYLPQNCQLNVKDNFANSG